MRYHFTPPLMAIKKRGTNKYWWGCGEIRTLIQCWEECKMVWPHIEEKSKRTETCPHKNLYTNVHSIIIHNRQTWEQHKCPSTSEWINKMWYIYTIEYYSAIKRNEDWIHARTWMNLENIILNEKARQKRHILYDFKICISQGSPE